MGYPTRKSCDRATMLSTLCSNPNSGVWTPRTVRPASAYFAAHARTYGSVRSQLTQVYVQKSTRTTRPRSASGFNGSELSQPVAPSNDGRRPSTGRTGRSPARRWATDRIRLGRLGDWVVVGGPGVRSGP